jgi:O-antigen ligase
VDAQIPPNKLEGPVVTLVSEEFHSNDTPLAGLIRNFASTIPALVIGYSLIIDPLINFGITIPVHGKDALVPDQKSTVAAYMIMPLLFLTSLAFATLAPPKSVGTIKIPLLLMGSLLALALLSSLWSLHPVHTFTLAIYQILLCGTLALAVSISGCPTRILSTLFWLFVVAIAVNLTVVLVSPPGPIGHLGIYSNKNTLGSAAACAFIIALFFIGRGSVSRRLAAITAAAGAGYLLLSSDSKTAILLAITAPVAACLLFALSRMLRSGLTLLSIAICVVLSTAWALVSSAWRLDISDMLLLFFGDDTFTGRTDIWSFITRFIHDSPTFGSGYRGFWSGPDSPKIQAEVSFIRGIGSGHNGYFDMLLDLGVAGLAITLIYVVDVLKRIGRSAGRPAHQSILFSSIFLYAIGRNMTESVIFWSTFFDNLTFVLVGLLAAISSADSTRTDQSPRVISAKLSPVKPC